ncbi:MAG: hypothetical protein EU981_03325 [Candidatus Liberibacter ctenarytainae]|uniref:CD-NTase-associated protein 12/Pycsar effector protein TIR domain-containing protein n=1 Tax=Candidatus Liberibacter ctenarytainae TaxID=2020335 RepID=A0A937AQJ1_9HYPH|nr:hypothetical protein [Candidatus Liberibacter ctenarytainae]
MQIRFYGSIDDLKNIIEKAGLTGDWTEKEVSGKKEHRFQHGIPKQGGIVNWYESTRTVTFQGNKNDTPLHVDLKNILRNHVHSPEIKKSDPRKIFIVHGHDKSLLQSIKLLLLELKLGDFCVLNQTANQSNTIIESLEKNISTLSTSYGIVLMTPDDVGAKKEKYKDIGDLPYRARQNVILEMGMLIATVGRKRMTIIRVEKVDMPSDLGGVYRIEFQENDFNKVRMGLIKNLREAGFEIAQDLIDKISS